MSIQLAVVLSLQGQQVVGDIEQGAQGRERSHSFLTANKGLPGIDQDEAQLIP